MGRGIERKLCGLATEGCSNLIHILTSSTNRRTYSFKLRLPRRISHIDKKS